MAARASDATLPPSRAALDDVGEPLLGKTIAGRFTILGRLGRGSMGAVYRARQEAMGRDVALKLVQRDRAHDPETKARFEREARAISSLTSPHTVTAFDFGEAEDGAWFLAMEMLEGETVGERLRRSGPFPWREAVAAARGALESLAEAHEKGIIHRDLKPDNLFLAAASGAPGQTTCKVLDFGIAKWMRDDEAKIDQLETQAGTVFGTPRYMSPEQAQGIALDARSDLYSLGVLLYQMLCGRPPFVDDDAVVVMASHIKDPPPRFADITPQLLVPEAIESVVQRVLAKAPADRPTSALELMAELDTAVAKAPADESGVRPSAVPAARARPWRWLWLLPLVPLAAFASVGFVRARARAVAAAAVAVARKSSEAPPALSATPSAQGALNGVTSTAENSAAAVLTLPSATATRKSGPPAHAATPGLSKKPNERYGRFE